MEFEKSKAARLASIRSSVTEKSLRAHRTPPPVPDFLLRSNLYPFSTQTTIKCFNKEESSRRIVALFNARSGRSRDGDSSPIDPLVRFEPLIISVECKDLSSAQFLVATSISAGFRKSGITSCGHGKKVIIAIRCSIRLEVPMGDTEKLMVSPEYVKFLVDNTLLMRRCMLSSNGFKNPDANDVDEDDSLENIAGTHDSSNPCI